MSALPRRPWGFNRQSGRRVLPILLTIASLGLSGACGDPVEFTNDGPQTGGLGGDDATGGTSSPSGGRASGGGGDTGGSNSGGGANTGGEGGEPSSGGRSSSDGGSDQGVGGMQDPGVNGQPGGAVVTLGARMTSANYSLVLTTGETPGGNGTMSSSNYRLRSGLIATTEGD